MSFEGQAHLREGLLPAKSVGGCWALGLNLMVALYVVEGKVSSSPILAIPGFLRVILRDFPLSGPRKSPSLSLPLSSLSCPLSEVSDSGSFLKLKRQSHLLHGARWHVNNSNNDSNNILH